MHEVGEEEGGVLVRQATQVVDILPCLLLLILDPRRDGGVATRQDGSIVPGSRQGGKLLAEWGASWSWGATERLGGVWAPGA